jgi:demethylmenaquinone methyltransferase / 2-methoxy-6-polyprenyl-1,4-benzoquinol methylase
VALVSAAPRDLTHDLPRGTDKVRAVDAMFDRIAPRYELANRLFTFGMDKRWRRATVKALRLPAGSLVLDIACGTADLCRELGAAGHRAVGADRSRGMLHAAETAAPLVRGDALQLPFEDGRFDGVVSGFALRNVLSLPALFAECARVLRHGGRAAFLDVSEPESRLLRAGHALYFRHLVPAVAGLFLDQAAYRYLPRSTAYLPPNPEMLDQLLRAGFRGVRRDARSLGIVQVLTGTRE